MKTLPNQPMSSNPQLHATMLVLATPGQLDAVPCRSSKPEGKQPRNRGSRTTKMLGERYSQPSTDHMRAKPPWSSGERVLQMPILDTAQYAEEIKSFCFSQNELSHAESISENIRHRHLDCRYLMIFVDRCLGHLDPDCA